jgi:hypothetical protein
MELMHDYMYLTVILQYFPPEWVGLNKLTSTYIRHIK